MGVQVRRHQLFRDVELLTRANMTAGHCHPSPALQLTGNKTQYLKPEPGISYGQGAHATHDVDFAQALHDPERCLRSANKRESHLLAAEVLPGGGWMVRILTQLVYSPNTHIHHYLQ